MYLSTYNKPTFLEERINEAFLYYEKEIIALHKEGWNEEDLNEVTSKHFKVEQYQAIIQLIILIYLEIIRGVNTDWEYYVNKYKLDSYKKCLICYQINIDKILSIFQLPSVGETGINFSQIENSFIVENLQQVVSPITSNFLSILEGGSYCELKLNIDCPYTKCN